MNCEKVKDQIINWLKEKAKEAKQKCFVVNVSGGIDSALVATLCCKTGKDVIVVGQPCYNTENSNKNMNTMLDWLTNNFSNCKSFIVDMSKISDEYMMSFSCINNWPNKTVSELTRANMRSRIRMVMGYMFCNELQGCLILTGNKIEDEILGFCTKGGDSLGDFSPIGDLLKSEVRELATYLGVPEEIVKAKPTDGLYGDGRGDEDILGITYDEAEWAYGEFKLRYHNRIPEVLELDVWDHFSDRQKEVLNIVIRWHNKTKHKMEMPPICKVVKD